MVTRIVEYNVTICACQTFGHHLVLQCAFHPCQNKKKPIKRISVRLYLDNSSHRSRTPAGVSEVPGCENQNVHQDQQSHQAHQLDVSNDLRSKIWFYTT